jgi:pimeloyl-ACP methyl ester carboxylesterase
VSSLTTDKGIVHYEVYGHGSPVILLHGWLGSWGLWRETMINLGENFRTYAIDFWGFGESGKNLSSYYVDDFVDMVDQFMEQLGIIQSPLVGHSMGGTVSLSVSIKYPERVSKAAVIGSPIYGSSLALMLKLAGYRPIATLVFKMMWALKLGIRIASPFITYDKRWPDMISSDLSRTTLESFLLSIASLRRTDLLPYLNAINIPVLGMYGERDVIVNPNQWKPIQENIPHARVERFKKAGHFIMLDEPNRFLTTLKNFLSEESPNYKMSTSLMQIT